jgi:hypothetical protein
MSVCTSSLGPGCLWPGLPVARGAHRKVLSLRLPLAVAKLATQWPRAAFQRPPAAAGFDAATGTAESPLPLRLPVPPWTSTSQG